MKIYNVIVEDRHTDIIVKSFFHRIDAVAEARSMANERCTNKSTYIETKSDTGVNILHISYSCEGDCVSVIETELRAKSTCKK